jgi:glycerol-3-phosphate dehydrogenase subunit C
MREGSLEAPTRHPIAWQDRAYYDEAELDRELRRQFDVCHGCRLCFNLCDTFPRLFDLVDAAGEQELAGVASQDFKKVADACTLCDMCFMAKCPYVPPHAFNIDIPHLLLRYRAVENKNGQRGFWEKQLTATDRNGRLCSHFPGVVNWATRVDNRLTRPLMEAVAGIDRNAGLPEYQRRTLVDRAGEAAPAVNRQAPAFGRKAVIYATCFSNYNEPAIGLAARRVLAHLGVECEFVYPECCGMPRLEQGGLDSVAGSARRVAAALKPWIERGYDVVSLVPSCALMLKFEWPLIVPGDADVQALSKATRDTAQYVVEIAKKEGLPDGLGTLEGGVVLHISCHSRAQNMGHKAAEMLRLIPGLDLKVVERCSGHGGSWGVLKGNFETAIKVGRPVAKQAIEAKQRYVSSECPLAAGHILQGMERQPAGKEKPVPARAPHPIELFAQAYGLGVART